MIELLRAGSRRSSPLLAISCIAILSACTTKVDLPYLGAPGFAVAHPIFAVGKVEDRREEDPLFLGEIRGGMGNPIKVMETSRPVADLVAADVAQALAVRGLLASPPGQRYDLDLTITRLDANQVVRKEAVAEFDVSVRDHATGTVVYMDQVSITNVTPFTLEIGGAFGSIPELHALTVRTLTQAINQALSKPGFSYLVNNTP